MITIIAAAALAAQAAPADVHAKHQQPTPTADEQMMADCKKCCEEMEGNHAADRSKHDEHSHQ